MRAIAISDLARFAAGRQLQNVACARHGKALYGAFHGGFLSSRFRALLMLAAAVIGT
jgi:hypothetical protein